MKLAVLRPEPGNAATVGRARAAGFDTLALPLFAIRPLAWDVPDPLAHDALLLTSANTLRFGGTGLARLCMLPVCAVGGHTAAAARAHGFEVVLTGERDASALLVAARERGVERALHLTGRNRTLREGGIIARIVPVYDSAALAIDPVMLAGLHGTVALLHSTRAARRLAALLGPAGRAAVAIAAFGPAIAAAAGTGWAAVVTAETPDDAALFTAVARVPRAARR